MQIYAMLTVCKVMLTTTVVKGKPSDPENLQLRSRDHLDLQPRRFFRVLTQIQMYTTLFRFLLVKKRLMPPPASRVLKYAESACFDVLWVLSDMEELLSPEWRFEKKSVSFLSVLQ